MDVAEEIGKRKDRAKRFGLPVPVFAAEVRRVFAG
jgi:Tho1/MOS11 C-terminal domain